MAATANITSINNPADIFQVPEVKHFSTQVVDPIVQILFALAVFYFVWGVFKYMRSADDPAERIAGGKHVFWGIVGIFIMISVFGILQVLRSTLGV